MPYGIDNSRKPVLAFSCPRPLSGSLYKRRGNRYISAASPENAPFWFEFRLPAGKDVVRLALRTSDRHEAVLRANALVWKAHQYAEEIYLRKKLAESEGNLFPYRREADSFLPGNCASPRSSDLADISFRRIRIDAIWDSVKDKYGARKKSLSLYRQQTGKFMKYAAERGLLYADGVTREFAEDYARWLNDRITTCGKHIGNLRRIWEMLFPDSPVNPWKLSIRLQPREKDHAMNYRPLSYNEIMRIRQTVERLKENQTVLRYPANCLTPDLVRDIADAILFSYYYGLRIGSFEAVQWSDFNLEAKTWIHRPPKTSKATLGTDYPILPPIMEILDRRRNEATTTDGGKPQGDLFRAFASMHRKREQALNAALKAIFRLSGVCDSKIRGRASWHSFRATFCTRLTENGCPAAIVKELAQHTKRDITQRYVHISLKEKYRWLSTLRPLDSIDPAAEYPTEEEL